MAIFEKIFWFTIAIFVVLLIVLQILASKNRVLLQNQEQKEPVSQKLLKEVVREIEVIVDSKQILENLENSKNINIIHKDYQSRLLHLDSVIDLNIDKAFLHVENNVDGFLDFHYSVVGEYIELGAAATGEIAKTIQDKLFGEDFPIYIEAASQIISDEYKQSVTKHLKTIDYLATQDVDRELNSKILQTLQSELDKNLDIQKTKLGTFLAVGVGAKVINIIAVKLAAKAGSKLVAKGAIKMGAKVTASAGAATAGGVCGPLVWICAPVAATLAWFGTDAVIIAGDEYLNREEFKKEILNTINEQKMAIKERYKNLYAKTFEKLSIELQQKYKELPAKERVNQKVIEKIINN